MRDKIKKIISAVISIADLIKLKTADANYYTHQPLSVF